MSLHLGFLCSLSISPETRWLETVNCHLCWKLVLL